jgi:hypothetical protein
MKLQLLVELNHNLNKYSIHHEIHVAITTLFPPVYLIVKLSRINLLFTWLEDRFISIGPFIDPLSPTS